MSKSYACDWCGEPIEETGHPTIQTRFMIVGLCPEYKTLDFHSGECYSAAEILYKNLNHPRILHQMRDWLQESATKHN